MPSEDHLRRINAHEAFIFLDIGYLNFTNKRNKHALLAYKSSVETHASAQVINESLFSIEMNSINTIQGYWRMGELLHATKDYQAAKENLILAMEKAGDSSYVMYDQKDVDFCIRPVSELLQFQKVAGFRVDLLSGYLLVNIHLIEEDTPSAETVMSKLRDLVAAMPSALAYYILGNAYVDMHQEAKAISAYNEGLSLRSSASLTCGLQFCLAYVHESTVCFLKPNILLLVLMFYI